MIACRTWWTILEFYKRPQSGQFYMIKVLENLLLSVTFKELLNAY